MQGFREGYEFFEKSASASFGSFSGADYVDSLSSAIETLENDLNHFEGFQTDSSKLQGDIAEFWHADTFNIDAILKGSKNRAYVDRSHDFASADISTNFGDKYGLKYYKDGVQSAKAQAKSIFERFKEYEAQGGKDSLDKFLSDRGYDSVDSVLSDPIYSGQKRLIPSNQLKDAIAWLERKIEKEKAIRPEQVKRYQETLALLKGQVSDGQGTESIQLSREDAQKLAELAKKGNIDAEKLGLSTEELVTYEFILKQAFKAGLSAATITVVLKLAPVIINAVSTLIQQGELDADQFKAIGFAAITGASEGFIRGTVSAGVTTACKAGLLGAAAKSINPSIIAMATVIVIDTMKNSFSVATGKMSRKEMADALIKETFVASVSLGMGILGQTLLTEIPVLGFMIGSFVGSVVGGFVYTGVYKAVLSFCVDTGFTMFGLVSQDYTLPEDVLKEIGISVFDYDKFEPVKFTPHYFQPTTFEPNRFKPQEFDIVFLKRGIIGIRSVGYV